MPTTVRVVKLTIRRRRSQGRAAGSGLLSGAQVWKAADRPGLVGMSLKMRPTGLGSGHYKDVPDFGIYCGEWCIGHLQASHWAELEEMS